MTGYNYFLLCPREKVEISGLSASLSALVHLLCRREREREREEVSIVNIVCSRAFFSSV